MHPFYVLLLPALFGSLIMGWICGLTGFICYLQGSSLLAEVLAHTSYPAVLLSLMILSSLDVPLLENLSWLKPILFHVCVLLGSTALLCGYRLFYGSKIHNDALFCWSISTSMGLSMLILSVLQKSHPHLLSLSKAFLYGQTIFIDWKEVYYIAVAGVTVTSLFVVGQNFIKTFLFDSDYLLFSAKMKFIFRVLINVVSLLSVLLGLQISGVLVITALMVAPAISAKAVSNSFFPMAIFSAFFGMMSAGLGILLSFFCESRVQVYIPPGPVIVFVASFITAIMHIFSWPNGLLARQRKRRLYKERSKLEDILKYASKFKKGCFLIQDLVHLGLSEFVMRKYLRKLIRSGFLTLNAKYDRYTLTDKGWEVASAIVRLHRLWEVYLVQYGGFSTEVVHAYAEEMEHVLTMESVEALDKLLDRPKHDPHGKPIPRLPKDSF